MTLFLLFKLSIVITILLFWSFITFKKFYLVHLNWIFQSEAFLVRSLHAHLFYMQ